MKYNFYELSGNQDSKLEQIKALQDNGNIKGGAFINIIIRTKKSTYKAMASNLVEKESKIKVQLDCLYTNTQKFKNQNKSIDDLQPLPNNEQRLPNYEKLLSYSQDKNTYYMWALTTNGIPSSKWYLNGQETTKENIINNGISSEPMLKSNLSNNDIFKIKVENIIAIESIE